MTQEDSFPAAERILADIENVFKKDPELKGFDVIPISVNRNKSPVRHEEHHLGLEAWSVRHVYCYVYHRLMDARQSRHNRTDPCVISRLLLAALLLNPDVPTFWNMRKELIHSGRLDTFSELHFTTIVLSRKPNSAEAFSHRKWILARLLKQGSLANDLKHLLQEELRVCEITADQYGSNYHAWQHRMWCMIQLTKDVDCWLQEWHRLERWVSFHVSDHSGLHYRQFLLKHLLQLPAPPGTPDASALVKFLHPDGAKFCPEKLSDNYTRSAELIVSELVFNADLIVAYECHEALWCHRRFVLMMMKDFLFSTRSSAKTNQANGIVGGNRIPSEDDVWKAVIRREEQLMQKCKPADTRRVTLHVQWVSRILGINLEQG